MREEALSMEVDEARRDEWVRSSGYRLNEEGKENWNAYHGVR